MAARRDKRARKKEHRDRARAQALRAYRRRRLTLIAGIAAVVLGVAGVMIYTAIAGDGDADRAGGDDEVASPCPSVEAPPSNPKQYDERPRLAVESGVDYRAVVQTSCGDIEIDLLEESSPKTVANFVFLANEGFYDGLTWHRVERNLVIQGGDPAGDGSGGPGYAIPDELPGGPEAYVYGAVGMANSGADTAGSQFFVVVHDAARRDEPNQLEPAGFPPSYAVFGKVSEASYTTLEKIRKVPVRGGPDQTTAARPVVAVYIETIEITTS